MKINGITDDGMKCIAKKISDRHREYEVKMLVDISDIGKIDSDISLEEYIETKFMDDELIRVTEISAY